jgi:hypothetical protein
VTSESVAYVSLAIAALGAFLGVLSFANQYLVRFKPRIYINNFFRIQIDKQVGYLRANSVTLNLSISNSKNSYGIIKDMTLGLYQTSETTPRYTFLFPTETSDVGKAFVPFTPLILPPKTSRTVFVSPLTGRKPLAFRRRLQQACVGVFQGIAKPPPQAGFFDDTGNHVAIAGMSSYALRGRRHQSASADEHKTRRLQSAVV